MQPGKQLCAGKFIGGGGSVGGGEQTTASVVRKSGAELRLVVLPNQGSA